jgi:hypothetical protein
MPITEKPPALDEGWKESNAPELIKWEKPGENVAGVLIAITAITLSGKRVPQYQLVLGEKQFKFLGTFDLTQKLTRAHIGCQVRVKYLGTDDNIKGGPSNTPMKVFSVQFKGSVSTEPNAHGVVVTDEDIPF